MIDILIAILIGIILGTITGLIPGIHTNLVAVTMLTLSAFLLNFISPLLIAIIIISMAITNTFLDVIPTIFLGAPDSSTALAVLPGHRYLLDGKGYEAVILTIIGSLGSLILTIILIPLITPLIGKIYPLLEDYIPYILILVSVSLILREKISKSFAFIIFLLAGILGIITLTMPNLEEPLFPLLSGLFGTSTLLISLNSQTILPQQKTTYPKLNKKTTIKSLSTSVLVGSVASFLPGLGPSQAAIIGTQVYRKINLSGFLILIGGLNTVNMVISFATLYIISRARNGAVVTVSKILTEFQIQHLILFLAISLIAGGIATFLAINLAKTFSNTITKVNYQTLVLIIIALIMLLVLLISGFIGFLVLLTGTFIGILPSVKNIGKNHLMGCLLLPIILFFLI
ncbi:MAG: tripartite tricarboxylate transporter permease [Nanoarchaeota archaeon]